MSDLARDVAAKILALVDEYPSEPFSLERKQVEDQLFVVLCQYSQQADNELDDSFQLGYDEGLHQAKEDYEDEINELQEEIDDLNNELSETKEQLDQAFAEGYEIASQEVGGQN